MHSMIKVEAFITRIEMVLIELSDAGRRECLREYLWSRLDDYCAEALRLGHVLRALGLVDALSDDDRRAFNRLTEYFVELGERMAASRNYFGFRPEHWQVKNSSIRGYNRWTAPAEYVRYEEL